MEIKGILIDGELTYCCDYTEFKELGNINYLDEVIGHLQKNDKVYKILVVATAFVLMYQNTIFASVVQVDKFKSLENKIFDVGRRIARVVCIAGFLKDSIKSVFSEGDVKGAGKALTKYGLFYGSIFLITWIFDAIEETLL